MQQHMERHLELNNALWYALKDQQLELHYQPQISIDDGHLIGAEALLRWKHPELGMISPAEFIPIAEESGLIIDIGEWVLRTAIFKIKEWLDSGFTPIIIAVNISAVQFRNQNLSKLILNILNEAQVPPEYLEIELTEATMMSDPDIGISIMNELYEKGIRMSIDDFGTGYSSLSYLKRFKAYKLKIDQSFVQDISKNEDDRSIVSAIIDMASNLGMQTIAEGVETSEQLTFLRLHGCNEVQGYYFSKPLPYDEFVRFTKTIELVK
jgi:EAL domain-containing protein (putative c-di-GMP-specific phosphodiesterase class I)